MIEDNITNVFNNKNNLKELKNKLTKNGYIMIFIRTDIEKKFFMEWKPNNIIEGNNGNWFIWMR